MRTPEKWLAAALYDTTRRLVPSMCEQLGYGDVQLDTWDNVPGQTQEMFTEFAKGILLGIEQFSKERTNEQTT